MCIAFPSEVCLRCKWISSTGPPHSFAAGVWAESREAAATASADCRNSRLFFKLFFIVAPSVGNRFRRIDPQPARRTQQEETSRQIQRRTPIRESLNHERHENGTENRANLARRVHGRAHRTRPPAPDVETRGPGRTEQKIRRGASKRNQQRRR